MIWPLAKSRRHASRAGLLLDPLHGGALAVVERHGARLRLRRLCRAAPPGDGKWSRELLGALADCDEPVNAVAGDGLYQLLLVERPEVPAAELAGAVRWRVRDMIDYPVENSVIDVFDVPAQARGGSDKIYAVVSRADEVDRLVGQVREAGAIPDSIDIAELCMRNVATQLEQDRFGVAFLLVRGHQGILTVTREGKLYLIRQMEIPVGVDEGVGEQALSSIALELQRSLDYFESHFDQRPIRDVVIAPANGSARLCAALSDELTVNVSVLDLNDLLETPGDLSAEDQSGALLAVGAALRQDDALEAAA